MVRTQLQIDEKTYNALRDVAHKKRTSMSSVVREILQEHFQGTAKETELSVSDFTFIGSGVSGFHDISERHDEALDEDYHE